MPASAEQPTAKPTHAMRWLAAVWFAGFAFLAMTLLMATPLAEPSDVYLYLLLPTVAAATAGFMWGGAISDPKESYPQAILRGQGVTLGTLVIVTILRIIALTVTDYAWPFHWSWGLLTYIVISGLLALLVSFFIGLIASATLHALGGRLWTEPRTE